ncbi:MAG: ABC transporter substrate-binding protein [Liquorilactobacillus ghanensis]|uniref:ABC transporter substrate-binding protein n=1 Tax=Liquorilactobacillus ghanensis TaxID=399370 RepID=UPI0039EA2F14
MKKSGFGVIGVIAFLALAVGLAGCGAKTSSTGSSTSSKEYPIKIKNAFGQTEIKQKPKRVVTIQWGNQDVALALGVVPVGFSAANFGVQDNSGLLPWTKKKLNELGKKNPNVFQDTDGLDFEAIAAAKPDVILAAYSGITKEDYKKLSKIAPVVAYPKSAWTTTWRQQVLLDSEGMGMKKQGKKLIKKVETKINTKVKSYPQLKNKTVAWVNFSEKDLSKFQVYTPIDPRPSLLSEFGLNYPKSLKAAIKNKNNYSAEFSSENASVLDHADIIVGYGNKNLLNTLKKDPVLSKVPAIKRGSVAFIASNTPLVAAGTPTPLSIEYTLNDYLKILAQAADKVN